MDMHPFLTLIYVGFLSIHFKVTVRISTGLNLSLSPFQFDCEDILYEEQYWKQFELHAAEQTTRMVLLSWTTFWSLE